MLTISHFCSFHKQAYNSKPIPAWRVYLESLEAEQGDGRDTILSEIATAREMVWEAISSQVGKCLSKNAAQDVIDKFIICQQPRYTIILSDLIPSGYQSRLEFCGLNPKTFKPIRVELCSGCKDYIFEDVSRMERLGDGQMHSVTAPLRACPQCNAPALGTSARSGSIVFSYFPLEEQLQRVLDNPFMVERLSYMKNKFVQRYSNPGIDLRHADVYMDDMDDGSKVRKLVLEHGIGILDSFLLGLTTDGIALNKHANNSVIPLRLSIQNFDPYFRAKYMSSFLFGIVPAKGSEVSSCGAKRAFHLGVYMRFLKRKLQALKPACLEKPPSPGPGGPVAKKAKHASVAAPAASAAEVSPAAGPAAPKITALLLYVCNDLRAIPYISQGRHIGATKNACHVCKVEALSRQQLGIDSACYMDSVRHLSTQSAKALLVKIKTADGTLISTHGELRNHFKTVFSNNPSVANLADMRPPAHHTHNEIFESGRRFEQEQSNLGAAGVPDADKFPIAGVPGLHGTPEFDLVCDNLSDPMHMIMNNCKDIFCLAPTSASRL